MKFYNHHVDWHAECIEKYESVNGQWATRADAEQVEKERDAYRDECITRGGRELQALCDKEQAIKDAVEIARLVFSHPTSTNKMLKLSKLIIDRYEGGKR